MNFLSHFYFDKNTQSPELGLGLILPDLIHQHDRSWVLKPEKYLSRYSGTTTDLFLGWKKHKEIDRYFHNSPYFKLHTQNIKEKIHPSFLKSPVWSFFLAHITLELTLDSLLITEKLIDVDSFYSLLAKVDPKSILEFLEINGLKEGDGFLEFYDHFLSSAYLGKYANPAELTYPLGRICYNIWKVKFTESEILSLRKAILDFCDQNQNNFLEIFDYIENELKKEGN